MEKVVLGKAVKLHGYLGEMKIVTKYDNDFDVKKIKMLYDENENEFKVKRLFKNTDGIIVGLDGVTLDMAKAFIGKNFYIARDLFAGKILIEDLKNSKVVFDDGKVLGKIQDIADYGSAEVFSLQTENGRELLFPNVKGLIQNFDYKQKLLTVDKNKLKEVSDYED